ncbi:MAG: nucleotide pyrophosphohydrolase [Candidatus Bathyarchaeota archaeon]|nr:MAG: nucleotide pyrophosphohydrolase [Candidatus Bathyarchaeota archaeon]
MLIREFQDLMRRIYFHRDSKRGATGTFNWLVEEIEELEVAIKEGDRKALEEEFADVLAWLASLANVVNIDLEDAAMKKYDNKCPKCRKMPCNCSF